MSYNYTTNPMSVGTTFTPSGVNKKVSISGVSVNGVLEAPETAFNLYLGDPITILPTTTVQSVSALIQPGYRVAPDYSSVSFDIQVQVNYTTSGTKYRTTELIEIVVSTPAPAGMTDFVVTNNFMPFIKSYVVGSPEVEMHEGNILTKSVLTLEAFSIPASGKATVDIPLALE